MGLKQKQGKVGERAGKWSNSLAFEFWHAKFHKFRIRVEE